MADIDTVPIPDGLCQNCAEFIADDGANPPYWIDGYGWVDRDNGHGGDPCMSCNPKGKEQ